MCISYFLKMKLLFKVKLLMMIETIVVMLLMTIMMMMMIHGVGRYASLTAPVEGVEKDPSRTYDLPNINSDALPLSNRKRAKIEKQISSTSDLLRRQNLKNPEPMATKSAAERLNRKFNTNPSVRIK